MFNKNTNIPWTMPLLITYTMPINPSLLERLLRLMPGQSGTGAWWCHRRRHWRSGPQHLSPQCRVCTDDGHYAVINSLTCSFPFTDSHSKKEQQKQNSPNGTYSAHGPVPLLPLSNVVYHIGEGWYPLLRVGLLRRPFLTWNSSCKNICRCDQQSFQHSLATLPSLITYTTTVHHSLHE